MTGKLLLPLLVLLLLAGMASIPACQEIGMPPEASFTAKPTSGSAPLEVHFTDTSTGQVTGWEWDFNSNGQVDSNAQHPVFVFENPGVYSVTLTAIGPVVKDTVTSTHMIRVFLAEEGREWPAYDFAHNVRPLERAPGKIRSFTMRGSLLEDGTARKYTLEGTYLGKETVPLVTILTETDLATQQTTEKELVRPIECHQVRNRIVMDYVPGMVYPEWIEITVWIPVNDLPNHSDHSWVYAKAVLEDSEGNTAEWCYYTDVIMRDEAKHPPAGTKIEYSPYVRGSFEQYDRWILHGPYGWAWTLGRVFAGQGPVLEDVSFDWNNVTYQAKRDDKTIGAYELSAWSISAGAKIEDRYVDYAASISPQFPLPLSLRVQFSDGQDFFEYRLTGLSLSHSLGMS